MSSADSTETSFGRNNSASERLVIGIYDQMDLFSAINGLAKRIQRAHTPPAETRASLTGIPLDSPNHGFDGQKLAMALSYSDADGGDKTAEISITDTHSVESARYKLMPNGNSWEMRRGQYSAVSGYLEHAELIEAVSPLFPNNPIFNFLLDKDPSGLDIVTVLEQRLRYPAMSKESSHRFHSDETIIHNGFEVRDGTRVGDDYVSSVGTDLSVVKSETRIAETGRTHKAAEVQLSVAALFLTRYGAIKKEYSYSVIPTGKKRYGAEGLVTISSEDDVDPAILKMLARRDQLRDDPVHTLARGINTFDVGKKTRRVS